MNDHGYCEESMDKLLILSQAKHAKWGKSIEKGAKMQIFRIWLPFASHDMTVNCEQGAGLIP